MFLIAVVWRPFLGIVIFIRVKVPSIGKIMKLEAFEVAEIFYVKVL